MLRLSLSRKIKSVVTGVIFMTSRPLPSEKQIHMNESSDNIKIQVLCSTKISPFVAFLFCPERSRNGRRVELKFLA
jgi:hypothetical protein